MDARLRGHDGAGAAGMTVRGVVPAQAGTHGPPPRLILDARLRGHDEGLGPPSRAYCSSLQQNPSRAIMAEAALGPQLPAA